MFRASTLLIAAFAAALATSPAQAQPWRPVEGVAAGMFGFRAPPGRGEPRRDRFERPEADARGPQRLVPLAQVIDQVRRRTPGRLLDAGLEGAGRPIYRVRWAADDGRRVDFLVDAESGRILSAQ